MAKTKKAEAKERRSRPRKGLMAVYQWNRRKPSIVGIGASAGGLAAFEAFFSAMPADTDPGMAFVLVQHLAPDHKSILSELVKRYTRMQVFEVEDGMAVKPNCAYIIPPNRDMAFLNGTLQLLEPAAPRGHAAADRLLLPLPGPGPARAGHLHRALRHRQRRHPGCAGDQGRGRHGDGAEPRIHRVRRHAAQRHRHRPGGLCAAAGRDAGPTHRLRRPRVRKNVPHRSLPRPPRPRDALKKIFILLRAQTGHDFSQYKQNTIIRRIERRMAVHQIERLDEYVRYLQQNPAEVEALFRDLLIGVTNFFRDPEAFEALRGTGHPASFSPASPRAH